MGGHKKAIGIIGSMDAGTAQPFIIVRTVSDRADGTAASDFNKLLPGVVRNSFDAVKNLLLNY
jgi:nucleoside phosphorylase